MSRQISSAEAGVLTRFVESGGSLIVFTGDQVKPGAYAALEQAKVLPARWQGPAEIGSYRIADWVKDHPLLKPFADPQYGDLRTLRFRQITRMLADPEARHPRNRARGRAACGRESRGPGPLDRVRLPCR